MMKAIAYGDCVGLFQNREIAKVRRIAGLAARPPFRSPPRKRRSGPKYRKRCSDPIFRAVAREGMMRDHEHPSI